MDSMQAAGPRYSSGDSIREDHLYHKMAIVKSLFLANPKYRKGLGFARKPF